MTKLHVFAIISTCGTRYETSNCLAARQKEIQNLHSRQWWTTKLEANGLQVNNTTSLRK